MATLRLLREQLDLTRLSAEDLETVAKWWTTVEEPEPTEWSFGGLAGLAFPIFDLGELGPRVFGEPPHY